MAIVKIKFPQIVYIEREIDVSCSDTEKIINEPDYVWDHMSDGEREKTLGYDWVTSAISQGYGGVIYKDKTR